MQFKKASMIQLNVYQLDIEMDIKIDIFPYRQALTTAKICKILKLLYRFHCLKEWLKFRLNNNLVSFPL